MLYCRCTLVRYGRLTQGEQIMEMLISLVRDGAEYTLYDVSDEARIVLKMEDNSPEMYEIPSHTRHLVGSVVRAINALRDVYAEQHFRDNNRLDYHRHASGATDAMVKQLEILLLDVFDGLERAY